MLFIIHSQNALINVIISDVFEFSNKRTIDNSQVTRSLLFKAKKRARRLFFWIRAYFSSTKLNQVNAVLDVDTKENPS
jgi:hypothetical protein